MYAKQIFATYIWMVKVNNSYKNEVSVTFAPREHFRRDFCDAIYLHHRVRAELLTEKTSTDKTLADKTSSD